MTTTVRVAYPVDALVSYHYYRERDMAALLDTGRVRLIGDSGAYSAYTQGATITLPAYAEWVARWRAHLLWVASLDVIGDPIASHRNWVTLRERYGLVTVPTVHAGADLSWVDCYAAAGADLIGLGGMAGTRQAGRALRWAVAVIRHARDRHPNLRFHLWGVTNRAFLDRLPVWSADSSGILGASYRYAQLRIFDPATGRHHGAALRGGLDVYRHANLLRRTYGVDPGQVTTSHPDNRVTLVQLAVACTQQYATWLQHRHAVTPPASLDVAGVGPLLHMVDTSQDRVGRGLCLRTAVDGPTRHLPSTLARRRT